MRRERERERERRGGGRRERKGGGREERERERERERIQAEISRVEEREQEWEQVIRIRGCQWGRDNGKEATGARTTAAENGARCEHVTVRRKLPPSPVILWMHGKRKCLPALNFSNHDIMGTSHIMDSVMSAQCSQMCASETYKEA